MEDSSSDGMMFPEYALLVSSSQAPHGWMLIRCYKETHLSYLLYEKKPFLSSPWLDMQEVASS